ncbi:RNase II stability modulator [compost metagenome]
MACQLETPEQAANLGHALLRAFDEPLAVGDLHLKVGLTIGYALAPLDGNDPPELIRLADTAMYAGKQRGKRSILRNSGELALAP